MALPIAIALGSALIAAVVATNEGWRDALLYRHAAIATGETWRLVTGHFVHVDAEHAALDITALLLIAWIFSHELTTRQQAAVVLSGIAAVDGVLWFGEPRLAWYAGLSGLLHAWFAAGATCWAAAPRRQGAASTGSRRPWGIALLLGLIVKLGLEMRGNAFWLAAPGFDVVTAAHRAGSVAGVLMGATIAVVRYRRGRGRG